MCWAGESRPEDGLEGMKKLIEKNYVFLLTFSGRYSNILFGQFKMSMRKCRNWQTSKTKDLVAFELCGFKSHLPHYERSLDFSRLLLCYKDCRAGGGEGQGRHHALARSGTSGGGANLLNMSI